MRRCGGVCNVCCVECNCVCMWCMQMKAFRLCVCEARDRVSKHVCRVSYESQSESDA